jgi:hypothetical protein
MVAHIRTPDQGHWSRQHSMTITVALLGAVMGTKDGGMWERGAVRG